MKCLHSAQPSSLRRSPSACALLLALAAAACSGPAAQKALQPPVANAGPAQTVNSGSVVKLDGTGSQNPEAGALSYVWAFTARPAGSVAGLNDANTSAPTFLADVPGDYKIELLVFSGAEVSLPASVTITASSCGANRPAIASLTASPPAPALGDQVTLTAAISDKDLDPPCSLPQTMSYQYSVVEAPSGSRARLSGATAASPTLTVDAPGVFTIQLIVTDSTGLASAPRTVTLTVPGCSFSATAAISGVVAPDGDAGRKDPQGNPRIFKGDTVQLTAHAGTTCSTSDALTYRWTLQDPAGSTSTLLPATGATSSFIPDIYGGTYAISLQVTDEFGTTATAPGLTLTVDGCGDSPVFADFTDLGGAKGFDPHTLTTALAGGRATWSNDDDVTLCPARFAQTYTSSWSVTSQIPATGYLFMPVEGAATLFQPGGNSIYQVELTLTGDKSGRSAVVPKTIAASCGNVLPETGPISIADVSPAETGLPPPAFFRDDVVTVQAHPFSNCLSNPSFTYFWTFASSAGSGAVLSSPTASRPGFTADLASGTWTFTVLVRDQLGNASAVSAPAPFTAQSCGANPVLVSLTDQTPQAPRPFDPRILVAAAASIDDDPASCPVRFSNGSYTFTQSVTHTSVPAARSLLTVTGSFPSSEGLRFEAGDSAPYTVNVTATGHNQVRPSVAGTASSLFTIVCSDPGPKPVSGSPGISAVAPPQGDLFPRGVPPALVFFTGDGVTLAAQVDSSACFSPGSARYTYAWSLSGNAETPALQGSTLAQPLFVANQPGATYLADVTVTDQWDRSAAEEATLTTGSCGKSAVLVTIADPGVAKAFDTHTVTATAVSNDDDGALCPARFANSSYAFHWSAPSAGVKYILGTAAQAGFNQSRITVASGDASAFPVSVTATGSGSQVTSQPASESIAGCSTPVPVLSNIAVLSGVSNPHRGDSGGDFNQGDTVTFGAKVDVSACYSNGADAGLTYAWAAPVSSTSATVAVAISLPSAVDSFQLSVADRFGNTSSTTGSFASSSCGAGAVSVFASDSPGDLPGDPQQLSGFAGSSDGDPTACPSRFAPRFTYAWTVAGPSTYSFSDAAASSPTFTALANGTYDLSLTATVAGSSRSGSAPVSIVANCTTAPVFTTLPTLSPATLQPGQLETVSGAVAHSTCATVPASLITYQSVLTSSPADGTQAIPTGAGGGAFTFTPKSANTTYSPSILATDSFDGVSASSGPKPARTSLCKAGAVSLSLAGATQAGHRALAPFSSAQPITLHLALKDLQGAACSHFTVTEASLIAPEGSAATLSDAEAPAGAMSDGVFSYRFTPGRAGEQADSGSTPAKYGVRLMLSDGSAESESVAVDSLLEVGASSLR